MKKQTRSPQQAKKKSLTVPERLAGRIVIDEFNDALREDMSDKPLPWPHCAAHARDRSAEEALQIVNLTTKALDMTSNSELLRLLALIQGSANTILRHLEAQGAQTIPD